MFEGTDCANYDMTPHAQRVHNQQWGTHPDTYYFSFVGSFEASENASGKDDLGDKASWLVWLAWCIGSFFMQILCGVTWLHKNHILQCVSEGVDPLLWTATGSDGLVTQKSQGYPLVSGPNQCESPHQLIRSLSEKPHQGYSPGRWHVLHMRAHHLEVVPFPRSSAKQARFFQELFLTLRQLETGKIAQGASSVAGEASDMHVHQTKPRIEEGAFSVPISARPQAWGP
jgi:hypothetical protein